MRDEYDFSKGKKNPYTKSLKERITIRIDLDVKDYFQKLAEKEGLPYQTLINMYLRHCADKKLVLDFSFKKER